MTLAQPVAPASQNRSHGSAASATAGAIAVDPRIDQATVPFPWSNLPKAFVWAICVGLGDIFECKSTERLTVADARDLAARAGDSDAHAILVEICGPTVDNGFPGCVLATLR